MVEPGDIPPLSHRPTGDTAIPPVVRDLAGAERIEVVWLNQLGGLTFALGEHNSRRFLKWVPQESGLDLNAERQRLSWANRFIDAPKVLSYGETDEESWMITRALQGESAVSERWKRDPEVAVRAIGAQLRLVHDSLPVEECPFDWTAETRLEGKRDRLAAQVPPSDLLVVCHGDACAPNFLIADDGHPVGVVDLGALGVGDRWADIAIATWSTQWNYGPGWEATLLDAYGVAADSVRTEYYRLLWELN